MKNLILLFLLIAICHNSLFSKESYDSIIENNIQLKKIDNAKIQNINSSNEFDIVILNNNAEFPIGYSLNRIEIRIINNLDKPIIISDIKFSDNFSNLEGNAIFRVCSYLIDGQFQNQTIPPEYMIVFEIFAVPENEQNYEANITVSTTNTTKNRYVYMMGYTSNAIINPAKIFALKDLLARGTATVTNTGNKDLYIYGAEFFGDVGYNYDYKKIILRDKIDEFNTVLIHPGKTHSFSLQANTSDTGTYFGKLKLLCNSKEELISEIMLNVKISSSIKEPEKINSFNVFFNQTQNFIDIKINSKKSIDTKLILMNMSGKIIYTSGFRLNFDINEFTINCNSIDQGLYIAAIIQDGIILASDKVLIVR